MKVCDGVQGHLNVDIVVLVSGSGIVGIEVGVVIFWSLRVYVKR